MAIFKGAGVAIATPFFEDGSVNYDEFGRLIEFQIANGTDAIIVCGTTGESATLSEQEHIDVIRYCIDKVAKRIPVIAGTGSNSTETAVMLSKEAEEAGADGALHDSCKCCQYPDYSLQCPEPHRLQHSSGHRCNAVQGSAEHRRYQGCNGKHQPDHRNDASCRRMYRPLLRQ